MSHKLLRSQGKISGAEFRQLSRERRLYPGLYKIHERQYARRPVGFRTRGRGPSRIVHPVRERPGDAGFRTVVRGLTAFVRGAKAESDRQAAKRVAADIAAKQKTTDIAAEQKAKDARKEDLDFRARQTELLEEIKRINSSIREIAEREEEERRQEARLEALPSRTEVESERLRTLTVSKEKLRSESDKLRRERERLTEDLARLKEKLARSKRPELRRKIETQIAVASAERRGLGLQRRARENLR